MAGPLNAASLPWLLPYLSLPPPPPCAPLQIVQRHGESTRASNGRAFGSGAHGGGGGGGFGGRRRNGGGAAPLVGVDGLPISNPAANHPKAAAAASFKMAAAVCQFLFYPIRFTPPLSGHQLTLICVCARMRTLLPLKSVLCTFPFCLPFCRPPGPTRRLLRGHSSSSSSPRRHSSSRPRPPRLRPRPRPPTRRCWLLPRPARSGATAATGTAATKVPRRGVGGGGGTSCQHPGRIKICVRREMPRFGASSMKE